MQKPPTHITVDLGPQEAEGIYSNLSVINHSPSEFIVDFARLLPGLPKARVYSRIIMTPQAAKALHGALGANLERFEKTFGEIAMPHRDANHTVGFQMPDS